MERASCSSDPETDDVANQRLAICIPTYNRAPLLRETVEAIRRQSTSVEIVVSDNASTDATPEFMGELAARDPNVIYVRQPRNRGADANYLEVVHHARAEFCWLMGSDDHPAPGALAEVEGALGDDVDVLLTDRTRMTKDMRTEVAVDRFLDAPDGATFDCSVPGELERYLRAAPFIGSLFSYLSSIVVRRSLWERQPARDEFIGSAYVHAARIFDMLASGGRLRYLRRPLVLCRSDNDSFQATLGSAGRLAIDFNYVPIAKTVFRDRPEAKELVIANIERTHFQNLARWKVMVARTGGRAAIEKLRAAGEMFAGRPGYRQQMLLFSLPTPLLALAYSVAARTGIGRYLSRRATARAGRLS